MSRLCLRRRGVVMSEAIVAMALIITISVAALSMLTSFATTSAQMIHRNEAINMVENCMECFHFCDTQGEFDSSLNWIAGSGNFVKKEDVLYSYETAGYTLNLRVSYGADSASFMATARDSGGKAIIVVSWYTRGIRH